jgi:cytochrome c-type biogenesis protein CcsB
VSPFAVEAALHWIAVALYIAGIVMFAWAASLPGAASVRRARWVTAAGLVPHGVALVIRWGAVGHGPYMMKYEVLSSNAWIAIVMLLVFVWRRPGWAPLGVIALPASILMVGFGLFSDPAARDLPPTLRSMWLVFHIVFNKLAVGAFILSLAAAIVLLRKLAGASGRVLDRLPGPDVVEAHMVRFVGFGFVFWTATIVAGAIWANQSWGRYWGWDPIEVWALVTWLGYGSLLHARLFFRLRPRSTAWGTCACFVLSVLTVFVFPFLIPSLHAAYFQ